MPTKIATLLFAAMATFGPICTRAYAANEEKPAVVIYDGEYTLETYKTTPLKIKANLLQDVAQGDVLTVNFTVGSAYNYATIDLCHGTTKMACNSAKSNTRNDGNFATTATETSVTITDEADIAGLKMSGLQLKGKNVTITKITLGVGGDTPDNPDNPDQPEDPTDITDLWSGSVDTGNWSTDVTVEADIFAPYKGGDILTVFLSVNPDAKYGVVELDDMNYTLLACDRTAKELDSYGSIQPGVTRLTYVITNDDMELLKANGLRIKGANVTITRIGISIGEALPDDPVEEGKTIVWKGNVNCGRWANDITVDAGKFASALAGDKLVVNATKNQRVQYGEILLQTAAGQTLPMDGKGTNLDADGHLPKEVDTITYTLTEEDATLLKDGGLLLKGSAITVTCITLESTRSGVTAVEEANTQEVETVYYNLHGIRVDNPTPGIYIVRRGKSVSKVTVR